MIALKSLFIFSCFRAGENIAIAGGYSVPLIRASEEPWNINTFKKPIILPAFAAALEGISMLANRRVMGIRRRGKGVIKI